MEPLPGEIFSPRVGVRGRAAVLSYKGPGRRGPVPSTIIIPPPIPGLPGMAEEIAFGVQGLRFRVWVYGLGSFHHCHSSAIPGLPVMAGEIGDVFSSSSLAIALTMSV
jgi:hypothetical protein